MTNTNSPERGFADVLFDSTQKKKDTLIWTIIAIIGIFVGAWLFGEDYISSLHGYKAIDTQKFSNYTYYIVALMPQLAFAGSMRAYSAYIEYARTTFNVKAMKVSLVIIAVVSFALDFYWDMEYKTAGRFSWETTVNEPYATLLAAVETFGFYTMGSEVLLIFAGSYVWKAAPTAWAEFKHLYKRFKNAKPVTTN